jgi:hypothetical protein
MSEAVKQKPETLADIFTRQWQRMKAEAEQRRTHTKPKKKQPKFIPILSKHEPNHRARRLSRLPRLNMQALGTCARCGLAFVAPTASRCMCPVAKPRKAS